MLIVQYFKKLYRIIKKVPTTLVFDRAQNYGNTPTTLSLHDQLPAPYIDFKHWTSSYPNRPHLKYPSETVNSVVSCYLNENSSRKICIAEIVHQLDTFLNYGDDSMRPLGA